MRFTPAIAAAVLAFCASGVSAHTRVYSLWVNGEDQGDGRTEYIRSPPNNNPVTDLSSTDLVCNVNGGIKAPSFVTVAPGDLVSFEWYHNTRNDDIIDSTHKGPIITYIADYTEDNGAEAIWTKIAEDGYDSTTSKWAVESLISGGGKWDVTLPSSLAAGKYLLRQEIIALHEANNAYNDGTGRGAQFYPSCAQIEVTGSGTAVPPQDFDFNTGYTTADPGIVFNVYNSFTSYEIPGPEVWDGSSSDSGSDPVPSAPAATSTAPAATSTAPAATSTAPAATSAATQPSSTPVSSAPSTEPTAPSTGCKARRRRRSQRKL
jgi:cellulase